jgi:hypothetical protein
MALRVTGALEGALNLHQIELLSLADGLLSQVDSFSFPGFPSTAANDLTRRSKTLHSLDLDLEESGAYSFKKL